MLLAAEPMALPSDPKQVAELTEALKRAVHETAAQPSPMDVLEYASKVTDTASAYVSYSAIVLGIVTIILTAATIFFQWYGGRQREREIREAIEGVTKNLANDNDFTTELLQVILQQQKLQNYIIPQIDGAVRDRAKEIIDEAFIEERTKLLKERFQASMSSVDSTSTTENGPTT